MAHRQRQPHYGPWPAGKSFYHYDQLLSRYNVGYHGPTFSYSPMPDQYALAAFQRLELAPGHKPVMAEIDLTSSHWPWAPLPTMVPWNKVGDGSIFDPMPAKSESRITVERSANLERQFYGRSMQYSMQALTSWVTELNDRTSYSSCSAMRSLTPPSASPDGPATSCRSRSSPATRPCSGRLPPGAGRTG